VKKPSAKFAFLEAHSNEWEDHEKELEETRPLRKKTRKEEPSPSKKITKGFKPAQSAFQLYCRDNRAEVIDEDPDATYEEQSDTLAEWWTDTSAKEHDHYKRLARKDRKRWENDRAASGAESKRSRVRPTETVSKRRQTKQEVPSRSIFEGDKKMSYYDMICDAIADLRDRSGSSQMAIEKYILETFYDLKFQRHHLRKALKSNTENGKLVRPDGKNSWKLSPDEKRRKR